MQKEKKIIYVSAIYISPPNTMGGNTKILLELINNSSEIYNFVVFTSEPETFKNNLTSDVYPRVKLIDVKYKFNKFSYFTHFEEIKYVYNFYKEYFYTNKIHDTNYFYSASDAGPDVLPIYKLKNHYSFRWIASLYLFIPSPHENIFKHYKFPFLKYFIYYFYQKFTFKKILEKFDVCLITNDCDKKRFPKNRQDDLLAIYGGVNIDQIERASQISILEKRYDAIYCGRLHPQKGISQLLDIWKMVIEERPEAILAIIGNGENKFEDFLRNKAGDLNIEKNITWLGYVNNEKKYQLYFQSKLFIHPTIYDNNGMVAAEALCSGLPVIMYDLKNLQFYSKGCIKVAINDKMEYAERIVRLIADTKYYESKKPSQEDISQLRTLWDWKNRTNIFKIFLEDYEKNHN